MRLQDRDGWHGIWTIEISNRSDAAKGLVIVPRDGSSNAALLGWGAAVVRPGTGKHAQTVANVGDRGMEVKGIELGHIYDVKS